MAGHLFLDQSVCFLEATCLRLGYSRGRERATEQFCCSAISDMNYMHKSRTVKYCVAVAVARVIMVVNGSWDMTPCALVEFYPSAFVFRIA